MSRCPPCGLLQAAVLTQTLTHLVLLPCCQAQVSRQDAKLQPLQRPASVQLQCRVGPSCCDAAQVLPQLQVAPVSLLALLHTMPGRGGLQARASMGGQQKAYTRVRPHTQGSILCTPVLSSALKSDTTLGACCST